jgi:density-regulated protein DRP1
MFLIVPFKTATKVFSTRLACGSSVTKNNQGLDEIVVQGDVSEDIYDIILETWPEVPEESLEFVEDKKKK